ncbi:MAG TPA: GntR family transcriptional regulator [Spirochaetota bacterium]|nr:GntR family transcriptional regulator [Spirochaetota bacterium]HPV43822.1 GntR family transcriptional regulator [Spirochaetota bacterium]
MTEKRIHAMKTGLSGRILDDMRNDIIREEYPIGSRLPSERELSLKYKASRFAVREAIAVLAQGGFVETHPQSGTFVRDFFRDGSLETLVQVLRVRRAIDRQTLESLLSFRLITETTAAGEAALRITHDEAGFLRKNLERKKLHLDNIPVLTECDFDFHSAIIGISGNIISRLVFQSFKPVYSFFTEFFYSIKGAPEASLKLNRKLLGALTRGDAAASRKAMEDILKYGEKKVYEAIRGGGSVILLGR